MEKQPKIQSGLGQQSFSIGWEDIIKGMSTSDRLPEAGFSTLTTGINPFFNKGNISSTAPIAQITKSNAGQIMIDTCDSITTPLTGASSILKRGLDYANVGGTPNGLFYNLTPSGWGSALAIDNTNSYTNYFSTLIGYLGNYYASTHNSSTGDNVVKWNGGSGVTLDWFHTTSSPNTYLQLGFPHPMFVFNNFLYIADGNLLHKYDGSSITLGVLTISTDYVITALMLDPVSGLLMVAYTETTVIGGKAISRIGLYDGTNSTQFQKVVPIAEPVFSFASMGGYIYIFYGMNFGIWNSNGVNFLRKIETSQPTKCQIDTIGNILFYVDGNNIVAYGEIIGGQPKIFCNIFNATALNGSVLDLPVLYAFNNSQLGFEEQTGSTAFTEKQFNLFANGDNSANSLGNFVSNPYYFPRPVYIKSIYVITNGAIVDSGQIAISFLTAGGTSQPGTTITSATDLSQWINVGDFKTMSLQMVMAITTAQTVRRVIIFYDFAE